MNGRIILVFLHGDITAMKKTSAINEGLLSLYCNNIPNVKYPLLWSIFMTI